MPRGIAFGSCNCARHACCCAFTLVWCVPGQGYRHQHCYMTLHWHACHAQAQAWQLLPSQHIDLQIYMLRRSEWSGLFLRFDNCLLCNVIDLQAEARDKLSFQQCNPGCFCWRRLLPGCMDPFFCPPIKDAEHDSKPHWASLNNALHMLCAWELMMTRFWDVGQAACTAFDSCRWQSSPMSASLHQCQQGNILNPSHLAIACW